VAPPSGLWPLLLVFGPPAAKFWRRPWRGAIEKEINPQFELLVNNKNRKAIKASDLGAKP